jgi:PAS domain S-box-containing protein
VRLAAQALRAPAAALWTQRGGTLELAAGHGLEAFALRADELAFEVERVALVPDVAADPRPADGAESRLTLLGPAPEEAGAIAGKPVRGCAIAPVLDPEGHRRGTLAVLDAEPRTWNAADAEAIEEHAALAGELLADAAHARRAPEWLLAAVTAQTRSGVMITEAGIDARVVYVNDAFSRATGYLADEVVGQSPSVFQASRTSADELLRVAAAVAKGEAADAEVVYRRRDGRERAFQISISPLHDRHGRLKHFVTVHHDDDACPHAAALRVAKEGLEQMVFERTADLRSANLRLDAARAELEARVQARTEELRVANERLAREQAALRASEARYRQLFANAGEAIYILHPDSEGVGTILEANGASADMHGYTVDELLRLTQMDLDAPEIADGTPGNIRRIGSGEWIEGESVHVRKDGTRFPVEFSAGPLDVEGSRFIIRFVRDITERKRAEEGLRQAKKAADAASRAKSAFLANMSHEIRTPMNAILGYAQLLQRDPATGPVQQAQLGVISKSGEHLLDLINDVLEMSRIEVGYRRVNREELDLERMVDEVERTSRARAEAKRLALTVTRDPEPLSPIVADGGKLRRVLVNLLSNAVKFTEHGAVAVRVRIVPGAAPAARLVVEVEDTGKGIDALDVNELFRPFAQVKVGIHAHGGTGLGLAISREFARLMGGDIAVESRLGKGSTFRLEIPVEIGHTRASEPTLRRGRVVSVAGAPGRVRILLVDDDHQDRSWMRQLLAQVGFDVAAVDRGPEALVRLHDWRPLLVLVDVHDPAHAHDTIRAFRAEPAGRRAAVVALVSGAADEEGVEEAGADGVLRKPCREGELFDEIQKQLGIEYTYGDPAPERSSNVPGAEDVRWLPAALVAELRAAVHVADYDRFTDLLVGLPAEHAAVGEALKELVGRYAYDQIEAILSAQ